MRIITQPEGLKLDLGVFKNKGSVVGMYLLLSVHVMTCLSTQNIKVSGPACFSVCYVVSDVGQLICVLKISFVRSLWSVTP